MNRVTFDQAQRAAATLGRELGRPAWLRGIAVERDSAVGYSLSVRVARGVAAPRMPATVEGVPIRVLHRSVARPRVDAARSPEKRPEQEEDAPQLNELSAD